MIDASLVLLLGAATLLAGCGEAATPAQQREIRFKISHYKVPCTGADVQLCLLISKDGGSPEYFYDAIEGFEYTWGYEYEISVEQKSVERPMADASSVTYKLKQVLKQEKVAPETLFELPVNMDGVALVESTDAGCAYFGEVAINPGQHTCADLAKAQLAVFRHAEGSSGLVLVEVK